MWDSSIVSHELYSSKLFFAQKFRAIESSRLEIKAFRVPDFVPPLYSTQQSLSLTSTGNKPQKRTAELSDLIYLSANWCQKERESDRKLKGGKERNLWMTVKYVNFSGCLGAAWSRDKTALSAGAWIHSEKI